MFEKFCSLWSLCNQHVWWRFAAKEMSALLLLLSTSGQKMLWPQVYSCWTSLPPPRWWRADLLNHTKTSAFGFSKIYIYLYLYLTFMSGIECKTVPCLMYSAAVATVAVALQMNHMITSCNSSSQLSLSRYLCFLYNRRDFQPWVKLCGSSHDPSGCKHHDRWRIGPTTLFLSRWFILSTPLHPVSQRALASVRRDAETEQKLLLVALWRGWVIYSGSQTLLYYGTGVGVSQK